MVALQDDSPEADGPPLLFADIGPKTSRHDGTALPDGTCVTVLWAGTAPGTQDEGWALVLVMCRVGWVFRWDMARVIVEA
jgi:hypothetical protein